MLCVEDYLDALEWGRAQGGLDGLIARADANAGVISDWVARRPWIDFLARNPALRSNTSVCLCIVDPEIVSRGPQALAAFSSSIAARIEAEKVGFDIAAYRDAPPGLRLWCGATVERDDLAALTLWLDWAYATTKAGLKAA